MVSYFSGDITKRSNYTKGICPKLKKETSVDQTLLLGNFPNIQENHDNCAVFFKSIDLKNIQFTLCADLKLNLILGLQNHTSKYPCCFCNKSTDCVDWLFSTGDKRTFGSIRQQNLVWKQGCNSDSSLKEFYNCKNQPLLPGDDETEVMEICNIPELHLYKGTINLLWNHLATRWVQEKWKIFLKRNSHVRQKTSWWRV